MLKPGLEHQQILAIVDSKESKNLLYNFQKHKTCDHIQLSPVDLNNFSAILTDDSPSWYTLLKRALIN